MEEREVRVPIGSLTLEGNLGVPENAQGTALSEQQTPRYGFVRSFSPVMSSWSWPSSRCQARATE